MPNIKLIQLQAVYKISVLILETIFFLCAHDHESEVWATRNRTEGSAKDLQYNQKH